MEEIKWGILGCGDVAERKSGPAFQEVPHSRLIAVMRRNAEKAEDFAKRHNVAKWYDDAEALINDSDVNAIYVATPPASHEELAIAALAAGKHVYLEKPMALDREGALRISQAAKSSSGKLVIAHYRRRLPAFMKVKELLKEGRIGLPLFVNLKMLQPPNSEVIAPSENNWRVNPEISGGGLFHDLAPHQLDLMICYFGEMKNITGFSTNQLKKYAADDLVGGMIQFHDGPVFQGLWCFSVPQTEAVDKCEIVGEKGKITFSMFGSEVQLSENGKTETFTFTNPAFVQQPMIENVVKYFHGKDENPCTADDAVKVMQIIDAFSGK